MVNVGTLYLWQEPASLRIISVTPAVGGGSGGEASTVTVEGNATEIIDRAAGTLLTVEEVDEDNVTLSLPSFLDLEDFDTLTSQMLYVFGPVGDEDLGWLTVTAKGIEAYADSSDPGGVPDYNPVVGTVTLTPGLSRPIRIISSNKFVAVSTITAEFDSDGELSFDGEKNVRILAPLWTDLSNTTWRWVADVRPGPGQTWPAFSVNFTGAPGAVINLASLIT